MKKKKKNKKNFLIIFVFLLIIFPTIYSFNFSKKIKFNENIEINNLEKIFLEKQVFKKKQERNKNIFKIEQYKKRGCEKISFDNLEIEECSIKNNSANFCLGKSDKNFFCSEYNLEHVERPDIVKAIYYSAYGANSHSRINKLIELKRKTEINSVVIDIKEVNGKIYFKIPTENFENIKPEVENIIRNPKKLIEKLHKNGIYIIGRIVLFKDTLLAEKRPDLAVKKKDEESIWVDYKGRKWVDVNSKEVWDYNLNIAKESYILGFDEINLDYIRFPSDGPMSDIYYPFSQKEINRDKEWGRAKILDNFYYYFTKELRREFPDIKISADVFGQVAIAPNDVAIGQILESSVLYFDNVAPMSYPSHYAKNFVDFDDGPDNHPYEVIEKNLRIANLKIDNLNKKIENAKKNNTKLELKNNFFAKLTKKEIQDLKKIEKKDIRWWLQAFDCTWCKDYQNYGKEEVQEQIKAVYDNGGTSWMLWNSASRYDDEFFRKK